MSKKDFGKVIEACPSNVDRVSIAVGNDGEMVVILHINDTKEDSIKHFVITKDNSIEVAETLHLINQKFNKADKPRKRKGDEPLWN
jgi:hypothetical protein